jgi:DNA-3-methyladenine glycosylase
LAPDTQRRLGRAFFARKTAPVAVELLGCLIHVERNGEQLSGRIVETEAYLDSRDLASHAAWSRRGRETMKQEPGLVYMYRSYGIHAMFNIVAKEPDSAGAVLIRAFEPLDGIETMLTRRGVSDPRQIASGPGKLCQALGLSLDDHLVDLTTDQSIWIEDGSAPGTILNSVRIGITKSPELPLRFFDGQSEHVSATRRGIVWEANETKSVP